MDRKGNSHYSVQKANGADLKKGETLKLNNFMKMYTNIEIMSLLHLVTLSMSLNPFHRSMYLLMLLRCCSIQMNNHFVLQTLFHQHGHQMFISCLFNVCFWQKCILQVCHM